MIKFDNENDLFSNEDDEYFSPNTIMENCNLILEESTGDFNSENNENKEFFNPKIDDFNNFVKQTKSINSNASICSNEQNKDMSPVLFDSNLSISSNASICSNEENKDMSPILFDSNLSISSNSKTISKNSKNKSNKKTEKSQNSKKYPYRNVLKIFGRKVIAFIKEEKNNKMILDLFKKNFLKSNPSDWESLIEIADFRKWILDNKLKTMYDKIRVFKDIWIDKECSNWKDRFYKKILTEITKYFLENETYNNFIFGKYLKKYSQNGEKIGIYLSIMPQLYRAIINPQEFINLK